MAGAAGGRSTPVSGWLARASVETGNLFHVLRRT